MDDNKEKEEHEFKVPEPIEISKRDKVNHNSSNSNAL